MGNPNAAADLLLHLHCSFLCQALGWDDGEQETPAGLLTSQPCPWAGAGADVLKCEIVDSRTSVVLEIGKAREEGRERLCSDLTGTRYLFCLCLFSLGLIFFHINRKMYRFFSVTEAQILQKGKIILDLDSYLRVCEHFSRIRFSCPLIHLDLQPCRNECHNDEYTVFLSASLFFSFQI